MREGRIILPMGGCARLPSADAITRIADTFGGYTVTTGFGKWKNGEGKLYSEDVRIVDVAYEPNWDNDAKLFDIASRFQQEAKQESVYIRYANGVVQLVTAQSCMQSKQVLVEPGEFDWDKLRADLNEPADEPGDTVLSEAETVGEEITTVRW
jgi:hypothetical protein